MATAKQLETARRNGASFLGLGSKPIHGHYGSPTYASWASMIQRCKNPNRPNYDWYGGRGVKVCARWEQFKNFLADMGERPAGRTLDRIDPNGHYDLTNCRWATKLEQSRNRRKRGSGASPAA